MNADFLMLHISIVALRRYTDAVPHNTCPVFFLLTMSFEVIGLKMTNSSTTQDEEPQPSSQPKAPSSTGSGASSVADVPVAVATGVAPVDASRVSSSTIKGTSPDERKLNELLERARSVSRLGPTTQQLRVVAQPSTVTVTEDSDSAKMCQVDIL